jgi:hypothetical protein
MSNFLNYSVQEKTDLSGWILRKMGHPLITVEITECQLIDAIDDAMEFFTKYVQFDRDYFGVDMNEYIQGQGVLLPDNVAGVFSLTNQAAGSSDANRLFSIPNQLMNAGMLPSQSTIGGGWVTYELSRQYMDMVSRMISGGSGGFQFSYNQRTKMLKLVPDPAKQGMFGQIVLGVNVLRPETQLFGEHEIKNLSLSYAKMQVGTNRSKIKGVQLLGGGNIENDMYNEGKAEKEKIEEDIKKNQGISAFFVG